MKQEREKNVNIYDATKKLKFGWVATATTATGYTVRMWGHNNNIHHSEYDFPPDNPTGYGVGYGFSNTGVTDETVFIVRPETREEMRERLARAGFGGE